MFAVMVQWVPTVLCSSGYADVSSHLARVAPFACGVLLCGGVPPSMPTDILSLHSGWPCRQISTSSCNLSVLSLSHRAEWVLHFNSDDQLLRRCFCVMQQCVCIRFPGIIPVHVACWLWSTLLWLVRWCSLSNWYSFATSRSPTFQLQVCSRIFQHPWIWLLVVSPESQLCLISISHR